MRSVGLSAFLQVTDRSNPTRNMSDIHIDDFYKDAAKALCRLYLSFPRENTIFVEDICGHAETDEFGMHNERYLAGLSTLLWLAEEGYLRYDQTIRQEAIDQAVLTGRCFSILTSPCDHHDPIDVTNLPESIRLEHGTHIYNLREALKSKSSIRIRRAMTAVIQKMLGD